MMTKKQLSETPMGKAIIELSQEMQKRNMPPISINVIGGFALMMHDARNPDCMTDIDYVGTPLSDDFDKLADKIGIKHRLGRGWINNDVMLTGNSMEDFEFATGKLHFDSSIEIGKMKINILNEEDVLRMKLIAVDTSLMAAETGGDFSRIKDLPDVDRLLKRQNISSDQIMEKYDGYILNKNTPKIIQAYQKGGNEKVTEIVDRLSAAHKEIRQINRSYTPSPYLSNIITDLYARYESEKNDNQNDDFNLQ